VLFSKTGHLIWVKSGPPNRRQDGRRPRAVRIPEEKWQITLEGIKSGNVSARAVAWHFSVTVISVSVIDCFTRELWAGIHNHNRPDRGVQNRTPYEAFLALEVVLRMRPLTV